MGLLPKQKKILDFIVSFSAQHGYAPSQNEIAKHFSFKSLGTVQNYLLRLERQGHISRTWNGRRSLMVTGPHTGLQTPPVAGSQLSLPLLGLVAAGQPLQSLAEQDSIDVPATFVKKGEHFVLRVKGESMINEGIFDGDYLVVKKQVKAENGETVIAFLSDQGATVKKFYRHSTHVELRAANPQFESILIQDSDTIRIEGIVTGLIRKLN